MEINNPVLRESPIGIEFKLFSVKAIGTWSDRTSWPSKRAFPPAEYCRKASIFNWSVSLMDLTLIYLYIVLYRIYASALINRSVDRRNTIEMFRSNSTSLNSSTNDYIDYKEVSTISKFQYFNTKKSRADFYACRARDRCGQTDRQACGQIWV